jgi:predicted RNA-binding protein YlqC (UPF0109 family)
MQPSQTNMTKSLLCNVAILLGILFISKSSFQKCSSRSSKEDSVQIPCQKNLIPSFCPNGPIMRPDAHQCLLFKLASIQTSQQHVRTLFRVHEESSFQVHPSGRHSVFDRKRISFVDTDMGRQLQPSGRLVYTVRTLVLIMKIACSRSVTVRTLG